MLRLTSTYADGPMGSGKEPTIGDIVRRQEWIAAHDGSLQLPVMLRAEHGKSITVVCEEDAGSLVVGDGLLTWERGLPLVMTHSDCLPIFLRDAQETMCGIVHAGWRGVVAEIVPEVLRRVMIAGILVDEMCMEIGPHIGKCCFEIKEDVAEPLRGASPRGVESRAGKLYGALADVVLAQAVAIGMKPENVKIDPRCTSCSMVNGIPIFASYRRDGTIARNMISVIALT